MLPKQSRAARAGFLACAVAWVCVSAPASGQGLTVPPGDSIYSLLNELAAVGALPWSILGQRPLSERRIGELLDSAQARLGGMPPTVLQDRLRLSQQLYASGGGRGRGIAVHQAAVEVLSARTPARPVTGTAGVDASINPLLANREGVLIEDGHNLAMRATVLAPVTGWLSAVVSARAAFTRGADQSVSSRVRAEQLYARGVFGNMAVTLGRDHVFFGQGSNAAMLNSLNARGLDMLRINTERPARIPGLSKVTGPIAATLYLADLGASQNYPHARLVGYKVSMAPTSQAELSISLADQIGGEGSPPGTLFEKVQDVVPLVDALFLHRTLLFSNKFVGGDARWRIPWWQGVQLYVDAALDDFDVRRLWSSLTEDGGYVWGIASSCLLECGQLRVSAEYHTTGLRYYTHGLFSSGLTLDHRFLGNQLGPKGQGGTVAATLQRRRSSYGVSVSHEIRSGDIWGTASTTPDDSDFHFVLLEHHPSERRWRGGLAGRWELGSEFRADATAGIEHVERFGMLDGVHRMNGLLEARLTWKPPASP